MTLVRTRARRGLALAAALPLCAASLTVAATASEPAPDRTEQTSEATGAFAPLSVTPGTALQIAQSMAAPGTTISAASFVALPSAEAVSAGVGESMAGFPTNGSTFGVLSTGLLESVPQPGTFANTGLGGGNVRGNSDLDVTIMAIDIAVPVGANCLSFDFKFLSEEYPVYVGSSFNDAFIAELNDSTWTTDFSDIEAPDNFAFDPDGNVVSINSTGIGGMTPEEGHGTAFDGSTTGEEADPNGAATTRLSASTEIDPTRHWTRPSSWTTCGSGSPRTRDWTASPERSWSTSTWTWSPRPAPVRWAAAMR